jgi:hypothetical protein
MTARLPLDLCYLHIHGGIMGMSCGTGHIQKSPPDYNYDWWEALIWFLDFAI